VLSFLTSRGGDTQYVNMHEAYDGLSAATKERIEGSRRCMFI
jgi:hypothetical protein